MLRSRQPRLLLLASLLLVAGACGIPRDIEGTTEEVLRRGTIRAGAVAEADTIQYTESGPIGVEIEQVESFASELDVDVEWRIDSEHELMHAVERRDLDIAVGGIEPASPWSAQVALSRPISDSGESALVAAVPKGENEWILRWERHLQSED